MGRKVSAPGTRPELRGNDIWLRIAFIENANAAHVIGCSHGRFHRNRNRHGIAVFHERRDIKPHTPFAQRLTAGEFPQGFGKALPIRTRWRWQ
jgi:hypothetical protein